MFLLCFEEAVASPNFSQVQRPEKAILNCSQTALASCAHRRCRRGRVGGRWRWRILPRPRRWKQRQRSDQPGLQSGGSTIFLFHLARLGLSIFFFLREEQGQQQQQQQQQQQPSSIDSAGLLRLCGASKHGRHWQKPKHKHGHGGGSFSERE